MIVYAVEWGVKMLAIINAKIMTVTNGVIDNGTILIDEGIIKAVGENIVVPPETEILDGTGKWVTPGLIDMYEHSPPQKEQDWVIPLAREFGFTTVCTLPDDCSQKEKNVIYVARPLDFAKSKLDLWNLQFDTLIKMEQEGISFCLIKDEGAGWRLHLSLIGMAVTRGVSFDAALRALTINPAKLLGMDQFVGSVEVGKRAELSVFNGDPFSSVTLCEATVIGEVLLKHQRG